MDGAIAKVKNMVTVHEAKIHGELQKTMAANDTAGSKGAQKPAAPDMAALQAMHKTFLEGVSQIANSLAGKKKISMQMPDGRVATAQVSMQ